MGRWPRYRSAPPATPGSRTGSPRPRPRGRRLAHQGGCRGDRANAYAAGRGAPARCRSAGGWAALGAAGLAHYPARPALGTPEPLAEHLHGAASTVRAQKFPVMMVVVSAGVV